MTRKNSSKEGTKLKKWQIVLTSILAAVVLIILGGICTFKFYLVPNYIDPMLSKAANLLNDDGIKNEIVESALELSEKGLIDAELINEYIENNFKEEQSSEEMSQVSENSKNSANTKRSEKNNVGATNVKVYDGEDKTYGYGKNSGTKSDNGKNTSGINVNDKDLYNRIKSSVSSEDWERGSALVSKIDMATVRSLLSDKAALKNYIRSVLTDEEYSECISLYMKYSYLIK